MNASDEMCLKQRNIEKVTAIFDIGKTNKKFLLFNQNLKLIYQDEINIPPVSDEDGFECDDIAFIERWIKDRLKDEIRKGKFNITGVNFSTYGASLVFLDEKGKRLTPLYNYLKPIPAEVREKWYEVNGGMEEFCRRTASPPLDAMLNAGVQILWLKRYRSEIFGRVKHILHFPQYLSFLLTGKVVSEYTSLGCHTGMWDFDNMQYHEWLEKEGVFLPPPGSNSQKTRALIEGHELWVGPGIHDSSASLAPYLRADIDPFMLTSTGTWCINMNPFNHSPLTLKQLKNDCLCYLSIDEKPVKSSRFFMGHIHDLNLANLIRHFKIDDNYFKRLVPDDHLIHRYLDEKELPSNAFFRKEMPENYVDKQVNPALFASFDEAYHRLVYDLTRLNANSINLISEKNDGVKNIFISGGFARNKIFVKMMSGVFPDMNVYTSDIDNATALGAALVISDNCRETGSPEVDLNLQKTEI